MVVLVPNLSQEFVGRRNELDALTRAAGRAMSGESTIVSIHGEAGAGKSLLINRFVSTLDGFLILRANGSEPESDWPFAIIDQLGSQLDRRLLETRPRLQELAATSSPQAIGTDLLRLIDELEARSPVCLVLDDLQWMDKPSVSAMAFVLRRLWADPVLTLLASRTGPASEPVQQQISIMPNDSERAVRISLTGLDEVEIAELAEAIDAGPVSTAQVKDLQRQTGGNALYVSLALQELKHGDSHGRRRGDLPRSLSSTVQAQVLRLPDATRKLLEGLAVLNSPTPLARLGAFVQVEDAASALEPALEAGLADWQPSDPTCLVHIRHALQRDAIYTAISPRRRQELHRKAVDISDNESALAHKVAAADAIDEDLAVELEQIAQEELVRGAMSVAATHLEWAANLSPDRMSYERRILFAGQLLGVAESAERMFKIRPAIESCSDSPMKELVLGLNSGYSLEFADAEARWLKALGPAEQVPELRTVASTIAFFLIGLYHWTGQGDKCVAVGQRLLALNELDPHRSAIARWWMAVGHVHSSGPQVGMQVLESLKAGADGADSTVEWRMGEGVVRLSAGDLTGAVQHFTAVVRRIRQDAVPPLICGRAFHSLALAQFHLGSWEEAALTIEQGLAIADEHPWDTGRTYMVAALIRACRGEWDLAEEDVRYSESATRQIGTPTEASTATIARASLAFARNNCADVLTALRPFVERPDAAGLRREFQLLWQPIYIYALVTQGDHETAAASLDELTKAAVHANYLKPVLAWLAAEIAAAEGNVPLAAQHFKTGATMPPAVDDSPLYRGLLEQGYGRFLRSIGRQQDAKQWFGSAVRRFTGLSAAPFRVRCEQETTNSVPESPDFSADGSNHLTSRERDVAALVGRGLTNKEIASELYLSSKTVEYHLGNIYGKLGISSRRQLRQLVQH